MSLPTAPKREPRPIQVSFKLSKRAIEALRAMAKAHNLSQASVVEHLILQEFKAFEIKKSR